MFTLCIYSNESGMHPAFVRANSYIIKKYNKKLCLKKHESTSQLFQKVKIYWKKEWNIIISDDWNYLEFPSEYKLYIFLLRWGQF